MPNPKEDNRTAKCGESAGIGQELDPHLLKAVARKWRLFPVKARSKETFVKGWPEKATSDTNTIAEWSRRYPGCNWGLALGKESGVFVIDTDSDEAEQRLLNLGPMPPTFTVKTGRGKHFYFQYPPGLKMRNSKVARNVDVKTDRGYVLFPPSIHPTGAAYKIIDDCDPAQAPQWLLQVLADHSSFGKKSVAQVDKPKGTKSISEGSRNSTMASVAGVMHRKGVPPNAIEAALSTMNEEQCNPPLPLEEVKKVVKSITTRYVPGNDLTQELHLIIGERPNAEMVDDAEAILRCQGEERIFHNTVSRRLVRVIQHKQEPIPDKSVKRDPETCVLADVDSQYLRLALGRSKRVFRLGKERLFPTDAPRDLAEMILSNVRTSPEKASWRRLRKISHTPILLSDGRIVSEPGYHPDAKMWIDTRGFDFIDLAAAKPKLSASECKRLIETNVHPFVCEYPFLREAVGQVHLPSCFRR